MNSRLRYGKRKEWVDHKESDPSLVQMSDQSLTSGKRMAEELAITKALNSATTEVWDLPRGDDDD